MCADRSVRYGWEKSPTDKCAVLLRSLLAIGSDIDALLRVIGGLDLAGILLCWWVGPDCDAAELWSVGECNWVFAVDGVDVGGAGGI